MLTQLESPVLEKYQKLEGIFREMGEVVVAMSGGIDSVLLAKVASDVLGDRALAVTADSPSLPRRELQETIRLSQQFGLKHLIVQTNELADPNYSTNPLDRCYFCKNELFDQLDFIKKETNAKWVVFGENEDDQSDHRPGKIAALEHGVRAPLKEAGLKKTDIRILAQVLEIPIWDKPASACLSSRIPYGQEVTIEKLRQVEQAEDYLWDQGFRGFRVRHHGEIARIEVTPEDMVRILEIANSLISVLKNLGFKYVTLDLDGYRRGSLNEGLLQIQTDI